MIPPPIKRITQKRLAQLKRNSASQEYQEWRKYVLERDGHVCQYPGCYNGDKLQVHHIKRFSEAKHLRTEPYNGITLCKECHEKIYGQEKFYEYKFFLIAKHNEKKYNERKES